MRKYNPNTEAFYLTEEDRGILTSGLRALQESPYIKPEIWDKAEDLLIYLVEMIEPEEEE